MINVIGDFGRPDHHPRAKTYTVDDNGLLTLLDDQDKVVAVYAAGSWQSVNLDQPPK